jgi:hypothetical protein
MNKICIADQENALKTKNLLGAGLPDDMHIFKPKIPIWINFWRVFQWMMMVYFMAIWYIILPFRIFCGNLVYFIFIWYIFPILVCCTKKNLATLPRRRLPPFCEEEMLIILLQKK